MEQLITNENVNAAVDVLKQRTDGFEPELALIFGSGLGTLANAVEDACSIPYEEVPGMASSTCVSHAGKFVFGQIAGRKVVCMQGRLHAYEGYTAQQIAFPVHVMQGMGAGTLLVTNAAGGIDESYGVGDLMLIEDHINFLFRNPVIGPEDPQCGPRFFDMTHAYAPELRELARQAAQECGIKLHEGVYIANPGPSFETPAEIRAYRAMGADAVGMSTVLEVIAANRLGMKVLGISLISNPAAGVLDTPLSIEDVSIAARKAAENMETLVKALLPRL